jgi:hypothetical protein
MSKLKCQNKSKIKMSNDIKNLKFAIYLTFGVWILAFLSKKLFSKLL